jgi:4-hydroxy-tetrahydrodipicolinate synthase
MNRLPRENCLIVAITTPVDRDFRPDQRRLVDRTRMLLEQGCDGVTLFGTTGEGAEFCVADRMAALDAVIAAGVSPQRIVVSVGALSIPDIVALICHAIDRGVDGLLLMPPCVYRAGISDEGTFRFYKSVIEKVARQAWRLYLYHFPDICGVPITPQVIRRLEDRFPGIIAGVKDSGGELEFTQDLVRRFSHLSIFTGSEVHLPEVLATGARGTICGLANVMPRLMRAMMDLPTAFDRRTILPHLLSGDAILSRRPFIPSTKAVVAEVLDDAEWIRVVPPLSELPTLERQHTVADFLAWDSRLPVKWQNFNHAVVPAPNVVGLRRVQ